MLIFFLLILYGLIVSRQKSASTNHVRCTLWKHTFCTLVRTRQRWSLALIYAQKIVILLIPLITYQMSWMEKGRGVRLSCVYLVRNMTKMSLKIQYAMLSLFDNFVKRSNGDVFHCDSRWLCVAIFVLHEECFWQFGGSKQKCKCTRTLCKQACSYWYEQ